MSDYNQMEGRRMSETRDDLVRILLATAENSPEWTADAIIGSGWRPPHAPHEHEPVDPRDLIAPLDFCAVCKEWLDD